jgi:DNA-binding transcriptional LysR family regulator
LATKVGEVRRVVCASPAYLERRRRPKSPRDLSGHECISFSQVTPSDVWSFAAPRGGRPRQVRVRPRLVVNTAEAAIGSALAGRGIVRVLSYQVQGELASGRLVELLASAAPAPLPVHVVVPAASATSAKLRAFMELAVPRLREVLARSC